MSKAFLIMDMPKSCLTCRLSTGGNYGLCYPSVGRRLLEVGEYRDSRHPKCPLREIPERADRRKAKTETVGNWVDGWNACLDVMEGGSNNE